MVTESEGQPAGPGILPLAAIGVTVVAWASAFPLIRIGLSSLEPLPLAAARFGLAGLAASLYLLVARPERPSARDGPRILLCGAIGIALYNALLNSGQQSVTPGAASFLVNLSPIITALLAPLFLSESLRLKTWIGLFIALAGVAVISSGQPGGLTFGAGATLVLGAATCQATYFILQRPLVPKYGPLACSAFTIIGGALLLSPWLAEAVFSLSADRSSQTGWTAVLLLALVPSILGYASWTVALDRFGASRASAFLYLIPPCALTFEFVIWGDVASWPTLIGGALAILGVAVVQVKKK